MISYRFVPISSQKGGTFLRHPVDFNNHVNTICKHAGQKLHALVRTSNCVDGGKLRVMMNALLVSQFSYCPLVWTFHDRSVNKKMNKIHKRALRIAHKDSCSNFEVLLIKANKVSIQHRNLQLLPTEIFKAQRNLSPRFMNQIFVEKNTTNTLRGGRNILAPKPNTTGYGVENARFLGGEDSRWRRKLSGKKSARPVRNHCRKTSVPVTLS